MTTVNSVSAETSSYDLAGALSYDRKIKKLIAYAKGLRALADALERSPDDLPLPYEGDATRITFHFLSGDDPRAEMAAAARAIPCNWRKRAVEYDDGSAYFHLEGELHGLKLELVAFRDAVCERIVTGTEDREVEEVVTPAVTRKVTKPVDVVEWRCAPVLAPTPAKAEGTEAA